MKKISHERLKAEYGIAPEAFRTAVTSTLAEIREDVPMKRFTISTVVLTVLIMILLAGAALAITNGLGVLSFIEKDGAVDEAARELIQTEFSQQGGQMEDVNVRVRDAVSDGKTLFLAVECKANNEGDAVLSWLDAIDWTDAAAREDWLRGRMPETVPDWQAMHAGQTVHYMGGFGSSFIVEGEDGEQLSPTAGYNWSYDGTDTLVYHVLIDLQRLDNPQEQLTVRLHPTVDVIDDTAAEKPEDAAPYYHNWVTKEETDVTIRVRAGTMAHTRAVAEAPFTYGDFKVDMLEVTSTPLALYVTMQRELVVGDDNRSNYFTVADADGTVYQSLIQVNVGNAMSWSPGKPFETIYALRDGMPDALTLIPQPMGFDAAAQENLPEPLEVKLTVVE